MTRISTSVADQMNWLKEASRFFPNFKPAQIHIQDTESITIQYTESIHVSSLFVRLCIVETNRFNEI